MLKRFQRDTSVFVRARVARPYPSFESEHRDNDADAHSSGGMQALAGRLIHAGQRDTQGHARDMSRPELMPAAGRDGTAAYRAVPLSRCLVLAMVGGCRDD